MSSFDSWTTIESDPGVFTELITKLGVKHAEVQELYDLDSSSLRRLQPVYGLIFLFKWDANLKVSRPVDENANVYFVQQVIQNACATQALLSILMNQDEADVDLGEQLKQLREFTADFPPDMRGITLTNADYIRLAHNSFSPPEAHLADQESRQATSEDDVYHFISYIHRDEAIWELDGLQPGPVKCVSCTKDVWLDKIGPVIEERIALYSTKEIRFSLMAIVRDQRSEWRARLQQLAATDATDASETDEMERQELHMRLEAAEAQHGQWAKENSRRKHNYVPFLYNVLQILAEKDELMPLVEKARARKAKQ